MDVQMLGLDGFEANCQVREFNKDVVMIAQTANAFSGDKEKALEAEWDDYVSKPINEGILLERIQEWVNIWGLKLQVPKLQLQVLSRQRAECLVNYC